MAQYQLAQINIAKFRAPADDPVNADFVNAIAAANADAERADGFIWRLVGEGDNALDVRAFDDPNMLINLSVWRDVAALSAFVYRGDGHRAIMRRRAEWFDEIETHLALWWIRAGETPTLQEAKTRLERLAEKGPTPDAFTFKTPFPPPAEGAS